ncbi:MAG TPA: hypothetical protein VGN07_03945 [Steroidobacteraceae bacterium]|jgi:hypothetical protein
MQGIRKILTVVVAMAAAVTAYAAGTSVSGTWNVTVQTQRATRNSTMVLTQSGENVTGTYKGQRGDIPISGTVKGNALNLSYKLDLQGTELEVKYVGTVEGNTAKGTVAMGQVGEGKFTARKQ